MEQEIRIRREEARDFAAVEAITRAAFYNLYVPGCVEHYLLHTMRGHADFIPELDLVAELDGQVIGSVQYTKAWLVDEAGGEKEILTFGPVSISPAHQRKGYGKRLLEESFRRAAALGYEAIVIFGNPGNYVSRGFVSCKKHRVCTAPGKYPAAMLVKELRPGVLDAYSWTYRGSPVMEVSEEDAKRYDETLPPMEKKVLPSQEEFYIMSHSFLEEE